MDHNAHTTQNIMCTEGISDLKWETPVLKNICETTEYVICTNPDRM